MTNENHHESSLDGEDDKSITRSAGIVSIAVMASRLLGLVREQVIAYFFVSATSADAFYAAFRIPNLMRDLFGEGVLSKAFIAAFTATEVEDGQEAAWRLASRIFNITAIVLMAITLICVLAAPPIVDLLFVGKGFQDVDLDPSEHAGMSSKRDLTVYLARIMFPFLILVSLAAVAMGLLNSMGKFGVPACASLFFNLGSIVIGVWGYYTLPRMGLHPVTGMAFGVLVGGALQFIIQVPLMRRCGFRYRLTISFRDERVKQVVRLILPMILGVAALQVNLFVNSIFASEGKGWMTWIIRAFRLMHLPIGIFGVAISTAALPNLSKLIARGEVEKFRDSFSYALRLILLLTLPASIGLMVLNEPICRLVFEWGKTGAMDTSETAGALFCYAYGLCGFSIVKIASDGFYAFKDTRTPAVVSLCAVALNIVLNYLLIFQFHFGHRSLALSTSCTITLNCMILLFALRRRTGGLELRGIWRMLVKTVAASAAMGFISWRTNVWLEEWLGFANLFARAFGVFVPIGIGVVVFLCLAKLLKIGELNQLISAIARRR
ncbi:MAG: murein biosynthesis integral membrane protein MurJ [Candidatus Poribacteria bacterium]|nr:murein biosynthesis integral membrane protein MurJ [Candidatus Poribacteria bacterium]